MKKKKRTTTDPSATRRPSSRTEETIFERAEIAAKLREETIACRLMHEKLGIRRALSKEQVSEAATVFDAMPRRLSASKRIIDASHSAYRACVAVRREATEWWQDNSIPFPEPGVRLIRKSQVEPFASKMTEYKAKLATAAAGLQAAWSELREQAREELGELFDEADYPEDVTSEFALGWDFPNFIQPPEYLKRLHPALYAAEQERIKARFTEAIVLTEQAFIAKFGELVQHLVERLSGDLDGKPKTFKETTVTNLSDFFADFRRLDIGSSGDLQALVTKAERALGGASAAELRDDAVMRARLGEQMGAIAEQLDSMMIDRPKRRIRIEPPTPTEAVTPADEPAAARSEAA